MIPYLHIGIALSLLSIIFLLSKPPFRISDKIALALLVFHAIQMLSQLIMLNNSRIDLRDGILSYTRILPFTYGPLLYLYIKTQVTSKSVSKKKCLLHFLLFILFSVISFIIPPNPPPQSYVTVTIERNAGFPEPGTPPFYNEDSSLFPQMRQSISLNPGLVFTKVDPVLNIADYLYLILIHSSFVFYTFLILHFFYRHNTLDPNGNLNYRWLKILTLCFVLSYSIILLFLIIPESWQNPIFNDRTIHEISITCFVFIFCSISFKQSYMFEFDKKLNIDKNNNRKYKKSGLKVKTANKIIADLEKYMVEEKPYLNSELTIDDVSQRLGIPRYYLTQVINEKFYKNFSTYINEYRIKEAKHMLSVSDRGNKYFTVLDIAYEAGFNSKSTFNLVFKRITGITPSQFKKHSSYRSPEKEIMKNEISHSPLHDRL